MEWQQELEQAMDLMKSVYEKTGVNPIDNYGYRELATLAEVSKVLPSIEKLKGRTGFDATAIDDGYEAIEFKSGQTKNKTLTESGFASAEFSRMHDDAIRDYIFKFDGLAVSTFEFLSAKPIATIWIGKESISKIHPLLKQKQDYAVRVFEEKRAAGKKDGRDSITVKISELFEYLDDDDVICWLHGEQVSATHLRNEISEKSIKINQ